MASTQINISVGSPFGPIDIYITDKNKLAQAKKLIDKAPNILIDAYNDAANRWGGKVKKEAQKAIDRGSPPGGMASWPPLSEKYQARWGGSIYYNWGQYYRGIGIHKEEAVLYGTSKTSTRIYIGLPNQVAKTNPLGKAGRLTLQKVAKILEVGTRDGKIPPRPLWEPLYKHVGGKASLKRHIQEAIKRQLTKYSVHVW